VGGYFRKLGNRHRRFLAALDARTGSVLDWRSPRIGSGPGENVETLSFSGSRLYVGGSFATVGGRHRYGIAALDARTGALLPWKAAHGDAEYAIFAIRGQVIVSGRLGTFALDSGSGRTLPWPKAMARPATSFATAGPLLYVGGNLQTGFSSIDGHPRNNLATFDLDTGHMTSWAPNLAPYVNVERIVPSGDRVLVIGATTNSVG